MCQASFQLYPVLNIKNSVLAETSPNSVAFQSDASVNPAAPQTQAQLDSVAFKSDALVQTQAVCSSRGLKRSANWPAQYLADEMVKKPSYSKAMATLESLQANQRPKCDIREWFEEGLNKDRTSADKLIIEALEKLSEEKSKASKAPLSEGLAKLSNLKLQKEAILKSYRYAKSGFSPSTNKF